MASCHPGPGCRQRYASPTNSQKITSKGTTDPKQPGVMKNRKHYRPLFMKALWSKCSHRLQTEDGWIRRLDRGRLPYQTHRDRGVCGPCGYKQLLFLCRRPTHKLLAKATIFPVEPSSTQMARHVHADHQAPQSCWSCSNIMPEKNCTVARESSTRAAATNPSSDYFRRCTHLSEVVKGHGMPMPP